MPVNDRFIRISEMERIFGWSRSTVYRKVRARILPRPVRLGPNSIAWRESEISPIVAGMTRDKEPQPLAAARSSR